ncbi:MAG: sulfatase [Erysipelotrichaceae bacterium]|nr:sulfatase [Erysipelotrichaceae bacterium]
MNLVYINTHDTGKAISPYGYHVRTDSLLALAQESTLFTQAYCCGPTCSPSRAALLTGTYPHQNGMLGLAQRGFSLNDPNKHLANYLQKHGYQTVISGIQHEAGWYLDVDLAANRQLGYQTVLTCPAADYDRHRERLHEWDYQNALKACAWLKTHAHNQPFMLTYGMHSTHRPYPEADTLLVDERYVQPHYPSITNAGNRHDEAQFMTAAHHADENVRLIIETLKAEHLYEETLLIFTTDHGLPLPYNKCYLNDQGLNVSLIMRVPQAVNQGKVCDRLVSQIDIFPTVCDLLGLPKPTYLEGQSFAGIFTGRPVKSRKYVYAEVNFHTSYEPIRCVRDDRYKYIRYYDEHWTKLNLSNMDECYPKSFLLKNGMPEEVKPAEALYDTYHDPLESRNLLNDGRYQSVLNRLKEELYSFQKRTNDPILNGPLPVQANYKVNKPDCIAASSKNPEDYDQRGRRN